MESPDSPPPPKPARTGRLLPAVGLLALLAGALLLRAWGLGWGLPDERRYYPYHPDEAVLLRVACEVSPFWLDFTPSFYNYGSLYILLTRFVLDLIAPGAGWGAVPQPPQQPFATWVADVARLLLVGRWVTVLLGAGTVWLTWELGRRLFGPRAGWIAALFAAVAPILVLFGHYMTVDVPGAFFTTLALALAARGLRAAEAGGVRRAAGWAAACGAAAGLAAGTKYNGGLALLTVAVPCWALWAGGGRKPALAAAALAALAAALSFLLSTPGVLLETPTFLKDFRYELDRNVEGQGLIFAGTAPAWLYHFQVGLPVGLEWPLYLVVLAGLCVSLLRRRREDALLWLFIAGSFLALAGAERKFVRYLVPLIPPLLVLAGRAVDAGLASGRQRVWSFAAGAAALGALASTTAHLGVLAAPDSRDLAAGYLRAHAAPSDLIALADDPFNPYTPPVHPTAASVKMGALFGGPPIWERGAPVGAPPVPYPLESFRVLAPRPLKGALPVPVLRQYEPRFAVMSDYEYEDPERLRARDPSFQHPVLSLEAALSEDYELVREFRPRPSLAGFTWWSRSIPPHDWRYYMTTVRIYERRAGSAQTREGAGR